MVASVTESLKADFQFAEDWGRLVEIVKAPSLQMISFTITEKGYALKDIHGNFFPVVEQGRCIDVPLSCMEAAACDKPIVTTDFGEMREFIGKDGFYFIDSFDVDELNQKIAQALSVQNFSTRSAVLPYDWRFATQAIKEG